MRKKVLYAGIKYSYAKPSLGYSYEYYNFWDSLLQMRQLEVKEFDWVTIQLSQGKSRMNQKLLREVEYYKPDLVFFTFFRDEFDLETIKKASDKAITFAWFNDDLSRFDSYIKLRAPLLTWVSTITDSLIPRYHEIGCQNVVQGQFACNPRVYKKLGLEKMIDVSFVGQAHSNRRRIIHELMKAGIAVETWGKGWRNGMVSFEEMIRILNESKINLNLTTFSFAYPLGRFLPWWLQPTSISSEKPTRGINGRTFEVPCCGGFLLTEAASHLEECFKPGKEIEMFDDIYELVEKTEYFLSHEKVREKIAGAGYRRAVREHTYEQRFLSIFKTIGLL